MSKNFNLNRGKCRTRTSTHAPKARMLTNYNTPAKYFKNKKPNSFGVGCLVYCTLLSFLNSVQVFCYTHNFL